MKIAVAIICVLIFNGTIAQKNNLFTDPYRYVILKYSEHPVAFSKGSPATLNQTELATLSKLLNSVCEKHNSETHNADFQIKSLRKYYFQLVPVKNQKGETEVWVNALCDISHYDWKKKVMMVMDGGNCYFNIKINITKGTNEILMVNGYA